MYYTEPFNELQLKQIDDIQSKICSEYDVLFLTLSGSYAYGTYTDSSDIDIRGAVFEKPEVILGLQKFEQKEFSDSDTVIFGLRKLFKLLLKGNPNTLELISPDPLSKIYVSKEGQSIIDHRHLFLSKRVVGPFIGYIEAQMTRLKNNSIAECDRKKLSKFMMHIVRLFYTLFDILEYGDIYPRRDNEHTVLMDIRNGKSLKGDPSTIATYDCIDEDYFSFVDNCYSVCKDKLERSRLPDAPYCNDIEQLQMKLYKDYLKKIWRK